MNKLTLALMVFVSSNAFAWDVPTIPNAGTVNMVSRLLEKASKDYSDKGWAINDSLAANNFSLGAVHFFVAETALGLLNNEKVTKAGGGLAFLALLAMSSREFIQNGSVGYTMGMLLGSASGNLVAKLIRNGIFRVEDDE